MTEEKSLQQLAWEQTMIDRYGSVEAGKAEMKRRADLSKGVSKRTIFKDNPEAAREAGRKGAQKRWENRHESHQGQQ